MSIAFCEIKTSPKCPFKAWLHFKSQFTVLDVYIAFSIPLKK